MHTCTHTCTIMHSDLQPPPMKTTLLMACRIRNSGCHANSPHHPAFSKPFIVKRTPKHTFHIFISHMTTSFLSLQFVGGQGASACIVEESVVDSAAKTFTTYTRNISFSKLMSVEEKCTYYVSPENENW